MAGPQVRILLVGSEFLIIAVVTLLLATVFLKRIPLADNGTTLGTEEVSLPEPGQTGELSHNKLEQRYNH